jgi:hypothetical protein
MAGEGEARASSACSLSGQTELLRELKAETRERMPRACSRLCSGRQGGRVACNGVGAIDLSWVRSAKSSPPSGSARVRLAKRCVVHVQTLFLLWFCRWLCLCNPLALFAQNVKNGCATELTRRGNRRRGKPLSVGRVQRDRLRHVPAFACKYNRWESETGLPCKQQEIYREIFSRKLNRQNLARTQASRPGFHLAAKASGGGPPHDIPSSQRAFIAAGQKQRSAR